MSDTKLREKADALIAFTQQGPRFIAWVEAVTDSIAPAPEKVAKVETMADRIAADLKAGTFRGEQPAPPAPEKVAKVETMADRIAADLKAGTFRGVQPEPAAREMPEALAFACSQLRQVGLLATVEKIKHYWRNLAQPVAVGMTEELRLVLKVAEGHAERYESSGYRDAPESWRKAIAAVRQQAAQGRKVALGKARKMLEYMRRCAWHEETYQQIEEALAELDAAEGKVAG